MSSALRLDADAPSTLRIGDGDRGLYNGETQVTALALLHREIETQPLASAPTPPVLNLQVGTGAYVGAGGPTSVAGLYAEGYTAAQTPVGGPAQDVNVVWARGTIRPGNSRGRVLALTGEAYHQDATADGLLLGLEAAVWNQGSVTTDPYADNMGQAKVNILLGNHGKTATAGLVFGGDHPACNWVHGLYLRACGALGGAFLHLEAPVVGGQGIALDIHNSPDWSLAPVRLPNNTYLSFYDAGGTPRGILTLSPSGHCVVGGWTGAAGILVLQSPEGNDIQLRRADTTLLGEFRDGGPDETAFLVRANGALRRVALGPPDSAGAGRRWLTVPN